MTTEVKFILLIREMEWAQIMEIVPSYEEKLNYDEGELRRVLLQRLKERNIANEQIIRRFLRIANRKEKKYKMISSALRQTNASSQHDSVNQSLKVSNLSMISIQSECTQPKIVSNPPQNVNPEQQKEEELEQIRIDIKTKINFMKSKHQTTSPCLQDVKVSTVNEKVKESKGTEKEQQFNFDYLRMSLLKKLKGFQGNKQKIAQSRNNIKKPYSLEPHYLSIRKIDLKPVKEISKIKTETGQINGNYRLQSLEKLIKPKENEVWERRFPKPREEFFPQLTKEYMERNKRCLQILMKASKTRYKSVRGELSSLCTLGQEIDPGKQKAVNFFRVGNRNKRT